MPKKKRTKKALKPKLASECEGCLKTAMANTRLEMALVRALRHAEPDSPVMNAVRKILDNYQHARLAWFLERDFWTASERKSYVEK